MKLYQIALRNVRRHKIRSILSGTAIAVSAMAIVLLFSLVAGMLDDMEHNIKTYSSGDLRIRNKVYAQDELMDSIRPNARIEDATKLVALIEEMNGVEVAVPRLTMSALFQHDGNNPTALVTAVDFERELKFQGFSKSLADIKGFKHPLKTLSKEQKGDAKEVERVWLDWAKQLNNSKSMLMTQKIAQDVGELTVTETPVEKLTFSQKIMKLKTKSVPTVTTFEVTPGNQKKTLWFVGSQGMMSALTLKTEGIIQFPVGSLNGPALMMPFEAAQKTLRRGDIASEILIRVNPKIDLDQFAFKLKSLVEKNGWDNLEVTPWNKISMIYSFMSYAQVMYAIIAAMFFILGSTVIINTTIMVILERKKEIGTLGAMGFEGKQLVGLFFIEALYIGVLGSAMGVFIGLGISLLLNNIGMDFGGAMEGIDMGVSNIIYPRPTLFVTLGVFFYSIIVSSIATLLPSLKAGRIKPVEALRSL